MTRLPLAGLVVAVTGSRRATELAALISNSAGTPYVAPTVGIQSFEHLDEKTETVMNMIMADKVDFAIFMTGPGTYSFFDWADSKGCKTKIVEGLNKIRIIARSQKPASALATQNVHVDIVPTDNTSEGIAKSLKQHDTNGKTIAILWHGASKPTLKQELENRGANVIDGMVYNYSTELDTGGKKILTAMGFKPIPPDESKVLTLINDIRNGRIDVITFTSPPSARNLFLIASTHNLDAQLTRDLNDKVVVVAVGPPTRDAIESNQVKVDVIPDVYKLGPMIKSIEEYIKLQKPKVKIALNRRKITTV